MKNVDINKISTDSSSGKQYSMAASLSSETPNPRVPYFIGFEDLMTYGLLSSTYDSSRDMIINYVLYTKGIYFAKVSYVKDSFTSSINGTAVKYTFKFDINNSDRQTINITQDIVKKKISVNIVDAKNDISRDFPIPAIDN